ncbi:hypothetical protein BASA83_006031 [Batrachochytrium salamandrivorans]|nr:hypothetical protein BASA83_006031 [Batrachochytrium salamandrivorans]
MGVIKLDSFSPEDAETNSLAVEKAVMIIRSLLANELKDTNSVMYDLRGNSGAWKKTKKGSRFTNVFSLNSMESVNTLGQAYVRPMGVFNNAMCYSACEVFSGGIQGHGAGTIFGEDVSVTQAVRTGRYNGQLIEDVGIETDTVFRPRWSDLQLNPHYQHPADGKTVAAQQGGVVPPQKQKFSIPVSAAGSALGNNRITIVGKTAGKQVLKTHRNVRAIPTDDKYMKISTPGFIFKGISDSAGLYQSPTTAPGDGWNNLKGPWMIGNGVQYVKDVDSSIEAFFTASVGTKVNVGLDVALDTEPDCDFLYLSVKSSDGVEDFLIRSKSLDGTQTFNGISGRDIIVRGTVPFTTKSEKFSVSLKFTSDRIVEFTGATINSFTVSTA